MQFTRTLIIIILTVSAVTLPIDQRADGQDDLKAAASWSLPVRAEVRSQLDEFLNSRQLDAITTEKINAIWEVGSRDDAAFEILDDVAVSCALADTGVRELVDFCRKNPTGGLLPQYPILSSEKLPVFVSNNLRLLYARWLAQHSFFDEAISQLDGLAPDDVSDPAALLFYQCLGYHRLLAKEKCLTAANKLLEQEELIPRRYATLARLIHADLAPLKTDSLDEVSRLMDEVRRRLNLHRAGKRVRDQEEEIIAKLDKMIKAIEQKQKQQQQSSSGAATQPTKPAEKSTRAGGKGPGRVDSKKIGNKSGWGNLPPKQRQEALQQIGNDLPAHYREVIEEYFRKLAREGGAD